MLYFVFWKSAAFLFGMLSSQWTGLFFVFFSIPLPYRNETVCFRLLYHFLGNIIPVLLWQDFFSEY